MKTALKVRLSCYLMVLLGVLLALGCAPSPKPAPPPARDPVARAADAGAKPQPVPSSKYRLGDWVVYRYTGTVPGQPATMCEQVIKQQGNHLEILVTFDRGTEQRAWIQVLTDTPANQRANKIDALYELTGGKRQLLANPKNRDIFRLYSWIMVLPDGRPTDVKKRREKLTLGGKTYTCTIISGSIVIKGKPTRFSQSRCPDFLWTNGPSRFTLTAPEKDLVRSVVVGAGRQTPAELQRAPRCAPRTP